MFGQRDDLAARWTEKEKSSHASLRPFLPVSFFPFINSRFISLQGGKTQGVGGNKIFWKEDRKLEERKNKGIER